ncbi:MAG: GNAT family N-acetyltransferase [Bacteriovoracaceae bacterium]|nr:GNAT family N-acetyltransferase [Bacteriovoracaceae bacterium]
MKIRTATKSDLATIHFFIKQLAIYEKLEHEMIATVKDLEQTLFGEKPSAEVLLLEIENKPVAFALFYPSYSTFLAKPGLYLEDLFVLTEERGKGYGKKLLSHLAQIAVERNYGRMEWSVLDWNTPAIEFYKSFGAKPMDEWTVYRVTGKELLSLAKI